MADPICMKQLHGRPHVIGTPSFTGMDGDAETEPVLGLAEQ
jgi:hypothetical protein